uniref:RING-type domain-containing protein n=1 Tax=Zooxanthella nutricula TaxID=1333877 RepID=A0A7S2ILJ7_9DINO
MTLTNCGHVFHADCLYDWVKQAKNTCPVCREPLKPEPAPAGLWNSSVDADLALRLVGTLTALAGYTVCNYLRHQLQDPMYFPVMLFVFLLWLMSVWWMRGRFDK